MKETRSDNEKNNVNRLVLFAHYDRGNQIDDYVLFYLTELKKYSKYLVFISTSSLPDAEIQKIKKLCDNIILRKNSGYDFMSWKIGLASVHNLPAYDELIICNDSVYGPLFSFDDLFSKMYGKSDFWGITAIHAKKKYHIQSYFIVFTRNVFLSEPFQTFFKNLEPEHCKENVVDHYEVELTSVLKYSHFKSNVYISNPPSLYNVLLLKLIQIKNRNSYSIFKKLFSCSSYKKDKWSPGRINTTMLQWKEIIIEQRMPFIKVSLLRDNPGTVDINRYEEFMQEYTTYDPALIQNHLLRLKAIAQN